MAFVYWIKAKDDTDIFTQGYVGITSLTVRERLRQHISLAKRKETPTSKLIETGCYDVITICECSIEYAGFLENKLRPAEFIGLNVSEGGNVSKMTARGKARISIALKGVPKPKHVLDAMNSARLSKEVSIETRNKIASAHRGRFVSDGTRAKMSEARKLITMPPRKRTSVDKQIQTFLKKHPLDLANVNYAVWGKCIELYGLFKKGYSAYRAGRVFSFSKGSLRMMWVRFNNGYNPIGDERINELRQSVANNTA